MTEAPPRVAPVLAVSVAGASHERRGVPCQDAFAFAREDGVMAVAVADGLGSAPRSDVGATAATEAAVRAGLATDAIGALAGAREALESLDGEIAEVACTLMVVVVRDRIEVAHIGDGAVIGMRDDAPFVLSPPGTSEYVNETDSLASTEWEQHVRSVVCLDGIDRIALFTDGLQHAALRRTNGHLEAHAGFFGPLFAYACGGVDAETGNAALAELLTGPKITEHSDDDKTLVLVTL